MYTKIKDYYIPLFEERFYRLYGETFPNKSLDFTIDAFVKGSEENKLRNEKMYDYLVNQLKLNEERFIEKWVDLNLLDFDAKDNIYHICLDICDIYPNYYLSFYSNIGKLPNEAFNITSNNKNKNPLNVFSKSTTSILLLKEAVKKVVGNYRDLIIIQDNYTIQIDGNIKVLPNRKDS